MDVNSLLSAFNTQLHISEYAINTLSGFFRFLNNQTNGTKTNVPYGLLVQYDDEKAANVFFKLLNTALKQLSSPVNYRLISFSEKDFCTPSSHRITSSGQIFVLSDFSEEGDLDPVISEFEKTPGFIKIVCASSEIVEKRFKQNEHFFYRILPRHIHLEPLRSQEITEQFLSTFQAKGYKFTEDFKSEIAYYIESIYENANFQNEEFINDLVRRIELSMDEREGISAYKEEASVDVSFVPYSTIVQTRKAETTVSADADSKTTDSKSKEKIPPQPVDIDTWFSDIGDNSGAKTDFPASTDHTNVLLLALSTFTSLKYTNYLYDFDGTTGNVNGYYQLEPIPKMLEKLLADKKEYLDRIVMLCTQETLKTTNVPAPDNKQLTASPIEYFKRAIRKYLNPHQKDEDCFVTVNISLDSPFDGIQRVIETLRGIKNPTLYLDTHGGIRGIQRILEATVSLLKIEQINVKDAYAVEYDPNSKISRIISETENMKIYDFVAGVNEFITCGRADTLKKYSSGAQKEQEQELIKAIQNVANGIQWCCMPEFETGLENLQPFFRENGDSQTNNNQFSYLDIYKKDIELDYQELVQEHNVADEINWCLKKHFYQQALTLIESKISTLLINEWKLLKIADNYTPVEREGILVYEIPNSSNTISLNDLFNAIVYPITKYVLDNYRRPSNSKKNHYLFLSSDLFNRLTERDYKHFLKSLQTGTHDAIDLKKIKKYLENALGQASLNQSTPVPNSIIISDKADQRVLFQLLILHKTLKDVRNTMNHASSESKYQLDSIVLALKYYMKWIDQLNPNK